jgi:uncharacterized protein (DUF4415 family)
MTRKPIRPLTDEEEARIQAGIAADPDNPEVTEEQMAELRPFAEACPDLMAVIKRSRGRPKLDVPKEAVTLRVSPEIQSHRRRRLVGEDERNVGKGSRVNLDRRPRGHEESLCGSLLTPPNKKVDSGNANTAIDRHCEEPLRRSNPGAACCGPWIASLRSQ